MQPIPVPVQAVLNRMQATRNRAIADEDRTRYRRIVLMSSTSLPVLTIATRDHVEAVMLARRSADINRAVSERDVAAASPETLDTPV